MSSLDAYCSPQPRKDKSDPSPTSADTAQRHGRFRGQVNDRRKSSRDGEEEYFFRKEVNGKRLDDGRTFVFPVDPIVTD